MKISIQGKKASFSEIASNNLFLQHKEFLYRDTFLEVFEDLDSKKSDLAVVPIENSTYGSITQNYDFLKNFKVWIFAEVYLKINFHLISFEDASLDSIDTIYTHPVAIGQIKRFLNENKHIKVIEYSDTAGAVEMVKNTYLTDPKRFRYAAVASKAASDEYGMKVIKENIQENKNNYTRFLAIKRLDEENNFDVKTNLNNYQKTSIEFELGKMSLYKVFAVFDKHNIELIKIESRPIINTHWKSTFFIDLKSGISNSKIKEALNEFGSLVDRYRILGSYYKGEYIET